MPINDSNQTCTKFIDLITSQDENTKPEIFKITTIQKYLTYWVGKAKPIICTVCKYALKQHTVHGNIKIDTFMQKTNEFAQKMPENMIGSICTWLFMRYIAQDRMSNLESFELDPLSILFHNIIGCCTAEMGTDACNLDLCEILQSKLMSNTHSKKTLATQLDAAEESEDEENLIVENESSKTHDSKNISEKNARILIECLRGYVESAVAKKRNKLFSCKYIPACIFDNKGEIDKSINMRYLADNRIYVSKIWVERVLKMKYEEFLNDDNYSRYQPGVFCWKEEYSDYEKTSLNKIEVQNKKYNLNRGFVAAEAKVYLESKKDNEKYLSEHYHKTQDLLQRQKYILSIIESIPTSFTVQHSPVYIVSQLFPICKWCALCIEPRTRMIINDIYVMSEKKASDVGIGTGNFGVKVTAAPRKGIGSSSKKIHMSQCNYSLGFSKSSFSLFLLHSVFNEWCESKFPLLKSIVNMQDKEEEILSLQKHQDPNKSIYCTGNIRRMYIESDLHQKDITYRCFIIFAVRILQILLKLNVRLSKERSTIKKIAHEHNIPISLIFA